MKRADSMNELLVKRIGVRNDGLRAGSGSK